MFHYIKKFFFFKEKIDKFSLVKLYDVVYKYISIQSTDELISDPWCDPEIKRLLKNINRIFRKKYWESSICLLFAHKWYLNASIIGANQKEFFFWSLYTLLHKSHSITKNKQVL